MNNNTAHKNYEIILAGTEQARQSIYRFRYKVLIEELGLRNRNANDETGMIKDERDESATHLILVIDSYPAASIRLNRLDEPFLTGEIYDHFLLSEFTAFAPEQINITSYLTHSGKIRGSLLLGKLMSRAYELLREQGILFDFTDCAPSLVRFYEHLGYRRYTDNFTDPDSGYRIPMVLLTEDIDYLKNINSPFFRIAEKFANDSEPVLWFRKTFPTQLGHISERFMDSDEYWHLLSSRFHAPEITLFQGLDDAEKKEFIDKSIVLRVNPGDKVVNKGDVGNEMFIILEGAAEVTGEIRGEDVKLAILGKGDIFGEMAFLSEMKRTADVTALTDMRILQLNQTSFTEKISHNPYAAGKVLFNLSLILCERLRTCTQNYIGSLDTRYLS